MKKVLKSSFQDKQVTKEGVVWWAGVGRNFYGDYFIDLSRNHEVNSYYQTLLF